MENTQNKIPAPFTTTYSPQIPELLIQLNVSIALTTYQADKIVFISAKDENSLVSLPRTFKVPMGIDIQGDNMVIACRDEVIVLRNNDELAVNYPNKPDTYDKLFIPRMTYYVGNVDMHDIKFGKEGIYAINSSFSCLCLVNGQHNFVPKWKPSFIDALVSEDRCHLNGLVMKDGYPKYVTALGTGNTSQSWRDEIMDGGVLIDISTNQIIFDKLAMPHSAMYHNDELYMLLSATGQLVKLNIATKTIEVIKELEGFCRGMDIVGDYAFIGMSKLRKNSSTFAKLPFAETATTAGLKIIHLPTKALIGELQYKTSVDEIYDVKILKNTMRPNILNTETDIHKYSLSIPGQTFWADPNHKKNQ